MGSVMNDFKSKLPNLKEVSDIACKLFKDLKTSVSEIITDYKKNHPDTPESETKETSSEKSESVKPSAKKESKKS